ncbi:hypothetical protein ZIOFF_031901 [Zingiber officinale]|uniref:protein-serine/threonine phosphatase n=1 Tax=Zingiber officinale TaxID=94328 RepID=A0A8J5GHE2_ZINOF|nr:hypothetical protein ZIOFF_031901 [Zingiber officinale]
MACFLARLLQMLRKFLSMVLCSVNSKPSDRRRHPFQDHEVVLKKAARRRPARIAIPKPLATSAAAFAVGQEEGDAVEEVQAERGDYCVASKRGQRHKMEDGYVAFFGVFDGHGGRAAVDFVSEKLGKNIVTALDEVEDEEGEREANGRVEMAIRAGYSTTDREFLNQGLTSGACAATVLVKDGEMHVANVGDCRVVMSHRGVANALTDDHRAAREDERNRIQNNVTNQEAVDVVSRHGSLLESCKVLIELSCRRGNKDDITVMVIQLKSFVQLKG